MPTLKTKRRLVYAVYQVLKNIPPRLYPTTEEIKITIENILPELRKHSLDYIKVVKKAQDISARLEELGKEEVDKRIAVLNKGWEEFNKVHGLETVELDLDKDAVKTLKEQFNRVTPKGEPEVWGKSWFRNIEEYGVFSENLEGRESAVQLNEDDALVAAEEKSEEK